jgi:serine/threonine-protein kinase HipA
MKRCLITYETFEGEGDYSISGLKVLDRNLQSLSALDYTADEQRQEALNRAGKMSLQGIQLKLSAVLMVKGALSRLLIATVVSF